MTPTTQAPPAYAALTAVLRPLITAELINEYLRDAVYEDDRGHEHTDLNVVARRLVNLLANDLQDYVPPVVGDGPDGVR